METSHFESYRNYYLCAFLISVVVYVLFRPPLPTSHKLEPILLDKPNEFKKVDVEAEMAKDCPKTGKRYAVVGVGFVGRCIVEMLLARGDGDGKNGNSIVCIDMMKQNPFETAPSWCHASCEKYTKPIENVAKRIEYVQADVTKIESLVAALKDKNVDVVYCTVALISFSQRLEHQVAMSYKVNVGGAKNVCDAMIQCNIPNLVFTSTSNVVLRSDDAIKKNLTEESPRATRATSYNHYTWTKAAAEELVIKAHGTRLSNGKGSLNVVALRPCSGVFGHGDRFMTQRIANDPMGQVIVASSDRSAIDHIYVNNLVFGHMLAEAELIKGPTSAASGEIFNLVGDYCRTENIYRLMHSYWPEGFEKGQKRFPIHFFMPERLMEYVVAPIVEFLQYLTNGKITPSLGEMAWMTPPMLKLVAVSYDCCGDKAKKILNFRPLYTLHECCQRLSWQYYTEDQFKKNNSSESKKEA